MYKIIFVLIGLLVGVSYGQEEKEQQKLPPLEMLPKNGEVKIIYELPEKVDYEVFNQNGELVTSGNGEFIDVTDFKSGNYFIKFNDQTRLYEKK